MKNSNQKPWLWLGIAAVFLCAGVFLMKDQEADPTASPGGKSTSQEAVLPSAGISWDSHEQRDPFDRYREEDSALALAEATARREAAARSAQVREMLFEATDYESTTPALERMGPESPNLEHIPAIPPLKKRTDESATAGPDPPLYPPSDSTAAQRGLFLKASYGTPVYTTLSGEVVTAVRRDSLEGNSLRIRGELGFEVVYGYLSNLVVLLGMHVSQGDVIGYVGNSGLKKQPQLHYRIFKGGKPLNPERFSGIRERLMRCDSIGAKTDF